MSTAVPSSKKNDYHGLCASASPFLKKYPFTNIFEGVVVLETAKKRYRVLEYCSFPKRSSKSIWVVPSWNLYLCLMICMSGTVSLSGTKKKYSRLYELLCFLSLAALCSATQSPKQIASRGMFLVLGTGVPEFQISRTKIIYGLQSCPAPRCSLTNTSRSYDMSWRTAASKFQLRTLYVSSTHRSTTAKTHRQTALRHGAHPPSKPAFSPPSYICAEPTRPKPPSLHAAAAAPPDPNPHCSI